MKLTKEQAKAIVSEDSLGIIIIDLRKGVGIEVCTISTGPLATATLVTMGDAAAEAVRDAMHKMDGCQCDQCAAARALAPNAPIAQA